MNDCLKKRGLNVGQEGWCMISEMREFVRWSACGIARRDEPLTWMSCYSSGLSQIYQYLMDGGLSVAKPMT